MNFLEIRNFGSNAITVGLFGTLFFSLLQCWGYLKQAEKIRETESVQSVSIPCISYFVVHFYCLMMYGLRHDLLTFIVSGFLLGTMNGWVLDTATRHADAKVHMQGIITFGILTITGCFFLPGPYDYWLLSALYVMGTIFLCTIPYEIIRKKKQGSVSLKFLATVTATVSFWMVYGIAVGDPMLVWTCGVSIVALGVAFWYCSLDSLCEPSDETERTS